MLLLAQFEESGSIFVWSLVLIGFLLAAFFAVAWVKKWVKKEDGPAGGFTLSELRQLHKEGKMTAEEFERAKATIVQSSRLPPRQSPPRDSS